MKEVLWSNLQVLWFHLQAGPDSKLLLTEIIIHPSGNLFLVIWEYPHSWRQSKLSSLLTWASVAKVDLANSSEGNERSKLALGLSLTALMLKTYFLSLIVFSLASVTASEKPHIYKPVKICYFKGWVLQAINILLLV